MAKAQPKAKTAYELLERVCAVIAAKPTRYNQSDWCTERKCGTAFCRAGWMVVLHDGPDAARNAPDIASRAEALLGLTPDESWPLFSTQQLFAKGTNGLRVGTPEYVQAGIDGTRAFMAKHEAHLKARKLDGV